MLQKKWSYIVGAIVVGVVVIWAVTMTPWWRTFRSGGELTDQQCQTLADFVMDKIEADIKDDDLANTIRDEVAEVKKAPGSAKESEISGTFKHGLTRSNLVTLGRFIDEKLADGLVGKELANEINEEYKRLKAEPQKIAKAS